MNTCGRGPARPGAAADPGQWETHKPPDLQSPLPAEQAGGVEGVRSSSRAEAALCDLSWDPAGPGARPQPSLAQDELSTEHRALACRGAELGAVTSSGPALNAGRKRDFEWGRFKESSAHTGEGASRTHQVNAKPGSMRQFGRSPTQEVLTPTNGMNF